LSRTERSTIFLRRARRPLRLRERTGVKRNPAYGFEGAVAGPRRSTKGAEGNRTKHDYDEFQCGHAPDARGRFCAASRSGLSMRSEPVADFKHSRVMYLT